MLRSLAILAIGLFAASGLLQSAAAKKPLDKEPALLAESPVSGKSWLDNSAPLLGQAFTQKDLGLDTTFKAAYTKIFTDLDAQLTAIANRGAFVDSDVEKASDAAVHASLALLTPAQTDRLKQLGLQAFGLEGFSLSEVRETLQLSAEQRGLIDAVIKNWTTSLDAYSDKVTAVTAANPGSDSNDPNAALAASNKALKAIQGLKPERDQLAITKAALSKKLLELLDQKQKVAYLAMLGTPVKVVEAN